MRNQEAHLLRARALEATGHVNDALEEYEAVSRYYAGFEARSRYALLLLKQGRAKEAHDLFQEVVRASSVRPVAITPADREWIRIAKANMSRLKGKALLESRVIEIDAFDDKRLGLLDADSIRIEFDGKANNLPAGKRSTSGRVSPK